MYLYCNYVCMYVCVHVCIYTCIHVSFVHTNIALICSSATYIQHIPSFCKKIYAYIYIYIYIYSHPGFVHTMPDVVHCSTTLLSYTT
jgi:hypothetical protein